MSQAVWVTQEIEVYIRPNTVKVNPVCYASKNDWGRAIRIHLMDEAANPFEGLTQSMTISVRCRRPDHYVHMILIDSGNIDCENGIIDMILDRGMTSIPGQCKCNMEIIDGSTVINTQNFILQVEGC